MVVSITVALDKTSNEEVSIKDEKSKSKNYVCLACNDLMIVCNQGKKRNHYFRHDKNSECSGTVKETNKEKEPEQEIELNTNVPKIVDCKNDPSYKLNAKVEEKVDDMSQDDMSDKCRFCKGDPRGEYIGYDLQKNPIYRRCCHPQYKCEYCQDSPYHYYLGDDCYGRCPHC